MQITRQADYAARALLHLARAGNNEQVSTGHVAKEQSIPPAFLPKIISQLSIAGILQTSRGARGGIKLAREPQNITLLEVIEAIDGPIKLNVCVRGEGTCLFEDNCPIQSVQCDIQNEMIAKLRNANFAQFVPWTLWGDQKAALLIDPISGAGVGELVLYSSHILDFKAQAMTRSGKDESQNWVFRHTFYEYRIGNRGGVVNNKTHSAQKYNVVIFWNLFILPFVDKAKVGPSDFNSNAISLAGEFAVLSLLAW